MFGTFLDKWAHIRRFSGMWQGKREVCWLSQTSGGCWGSNCQQQRLVYVLSQGLIEGDRAIILQRLRLSGSLMECWRCDSKCKLTPECLLCGPKSSRQWPCSPSSPSWTSKSGRKQSGQSPKGNWGGGGGGGATATLISFLLLQGVIARLCALLSPKPLSMSSFLALLIVSTLPDK